MIAPMNDWMLSVVPVTSSISTTPAMTAGAVETVDQRQPQRLEIGRQQQKHGDDGEAQADRQARLHFVHRRNLPADFDLARRSAVRRPAASARSTSRDTRAQIDVGDVGRERDLPLHVVAVVLAGHRAGASSATSPISTCPCSVRFERNLRQVFGRADRVDVIRRCGRRAAESRPAPGRRCRSWDRPSSSARRTGCDEVAVTSARETSTGVSPASPAFSRSTFTSIVG